MLAQGAAQWLGPHRRKHLLLCVLFLLPSSILCNVPKDFEQSPINDDIGALLEEEALISIPKNSTEKREGAFRQEKSSKYVKVFTSLNKKYESEMNLISDEAMEMSDFLPSQYNLLHERAKRETYEGTGDVDECQDEDVCNGENEVCTDLDDGYDCSCESGYIRDNGECFPETLAYGSAAGDSYFPTADEYYRYIYIRNGIAFASKMYYYLYISLNGVISFGRRYGSFYPYLFTYSENILCPYWADMDLRKGNGNVFYHIYYSDDQSSQNMLTKASRKFRDYGKVYNFNPTWMLVVTWDQVPQKRYFANAGDTVTFQLVLASDARSTRVLYIYNRMAWRPRTEVNIAIGYQSSNYYDRRRWSAYNRDRRSLYRLADIGSNTDYTGVYYFNVGGTVINYAGLCINWYYQWLLDYSYNWRAFSRLPTCACNGFFMWWDRRFYLSRWSWTGSVCFTSRFNRRSYPLARECCYRRWWSTLQSDSGYALRYHPFWQYGNHYSADILGKRYCCEKSNRCYLYRAIRPRWCYRRSPFFWGWAFGDPHITTMDDKTYIFNGWGEYTMMQTPKTLNNSAGEDLDPFVLQARTERATNKDGVLTDATVFTAFASTDYSGDVFFVELSPASKSEFVIFRNGKDLSKLFREDANFTETDDQGGLSVSRENEDVIGVFASGITVRVMMGPKLLTVSVGLSEDYKGQMSGLMGNYNDDNTDDYLFPNGTTLPADSTEATLYQYGLTWQIDPDESFMRYPEARNATDYAHPEFTPLFLDQKTDDERNAAIAACGGDDTNLPCIFDFLATGDQSIADSTKQTDSTAASDRLEQSNVAPDLTSSVTVINVTVNQEATFALNYTDDAGDTISLNFANQPVVGFNVTTQEETDTGKISYVSWTPQNSDPVSISVLAQDQKNASSDQIDIEIRLCDECSGNGDCDFENTRAGANEDTNTAFQLAACVCNTGYRGDNCSEDIDGCLEEPCFEGQECTDLPADQQEDFGRLRNCSSCPEGYKPDGEKCEDIDECEDNKGGCPQECSNTDGGFTCMCSEGYRKVGEECQDINECVEGLHFCEQICNNIDGDYTCLCQELFYLDTNNRSCILNETAAAESACNSLNCEYGCKQQNGNATCFCPSGFELDPANDSTCNDTNECDQNVCAQGCVNTQGSYYCTCFDGFIQAEDKISCTECTGLAYGTNCTLRCNCGDRYSDCDSVRGCLCNTGWLGVRCDQDVDECQDDPNICQSSPGTFCSNIAGSYECICPVGFEQLDDSSCQDINECETEANNCDQVCTNVDGSYTCSCRAGYKRVNNKCEDIDECSADQNECTQICSNAIGSYNCECNFGYRLTDDRITCEQVENVCLDVINLNCSQGCTVQRETEQAFCFCNLGYRLGTDKQTCIDIVECDDTDLNKCSHTCVNTIGGFNCSCPIGYELSNDMVNCTECDNQHWGAECAELCECGLGAEKCDSEMGCVCKAGWLGAKCDQDRDECADVDTTCPENSVCVNNPGSFRCQCREGFKLNETDNTCENIDECDSDLNTCDQICTDTVGNFVCTCREGFTRTTDKCENVNECETGKNDCDHICRDTEGSYACSCRPGFVLNTVDRRQCISQTTCTTLLTCAQACQVLNGVESCFCDRGFELEADNETCTDVNECTADPATDPCTDPRATCNNIVNGGGYECLCEAGSKIQSDGVYCIDCVEGTYGIDCNTTCNCVTTNTESCMKNNGTCVCLTGWEGDRCETDINECDTVNCTANSECQNTNGSYICACDAGFYRSRDICEVCDGSRWGRNCVNLCTCSINSVSCNATNGACTCMSGWEGNDCTSDIDECDDTTICDSTPNSQCDNIDGSYTCNCVSGYRLNPDTNTCDNIDECLEGTDTCLQECADDVGSFNCSCSPGYTGTGNTCTDVDECTLTPAICDPVPNSTCNNTMGGYICECDSGYEKNDTTNLCQDIDECVVTPAICDSEVNTDCVNTEASYNCSCKDGYFFQSTSNECEDIDDCADVTVCNSFPNTVCDNKIGSYECICEDGYKNDTALNQCIDIDECSEYPTICASQVNRECENLVGNYSCICKSGFNLNTTSGLCDDIDECSGSHGCEYLCVNAGGTFECICPANQVVGLDRKSCEPTVTIVAEVRLAGELTNNNSNSAYYTKLIAEITRELTTYFRTIFGDALVQVIVISLRPGSIVANYTTQLNTKIQPDPNGRFVKATNDLIYTNVTLNGDPVLVEGALIGGQNVSDDLCNAFVMLEDCGGGVCLVTDGLPSCNALSQGDDFRVVLGLSIGIPLFLAVVGTIVIVLILRVKRSKDSEVSEDDNGNGDVRPFASKLATRDTFYNMHRGPYLPYSQGSVSSGSETGSRRQPLRGSFRWNDNGKDTRRDYDNPDSHFSWDFLYKIITPTEQFQIRRPRVSESPTRSSRKNPYSSA